MEERNEYVHKMEVNWSLLTEGITLPVKEQVVFGKIMGRYLVKGEAKGIRIVINGKTFVAYVRNVDYSQKYIRKNDVLQIRYPRNGDLARELQQIFHSSYSFFKNARDVRPEGTRSMPKLPEENKEYLAIYTTEYDDTYIFETIETVDIKSAKDGMIGKSEYAVELDYSLKLTDPSSTIIEVERTAKIRKLDRKIGDNLKQLYGFRCQICGKMIGEQYGSHIAEAHHIDYFVKSLNNDASNQMVVCPNHHRIIHDADPTFDRNLMKYTYENGFEEMLVVNLNL